MKPINVVSMAILLAGFAGITTSAAYAETVSQTGSVAVVRGVDDAGTAAQRQTARGRSGVVIFRGESTPTDVTRPAGAAAPAQSRQIVGGQNLWIRDAGTNDVTACSLRYDYYGNRVVRCSDDRY